MSEQQAPLLPTTTQIACWREEAKFRYPKFDLEFHLERNCDGLWIYAYRFVPLSGAPAVPCDLFPLVLRWQPVELLWRDDGTSELDLLFFLHPDQAEFPARRLSLPSATVLREQQALLSLVVFTLSFGLFGWFSWILVYQPWLAVVWLGSAVQVVLSPKLRFWLPGAVVVGFLLCVLNVGTLWTLSLVLLPLLAVFGCASAGLGCLQLIDLAQRVRAWLISRKSAARLVSRSSALVLLSGEPADSLPMP